MKYPKEIEELIENFQQFPGIGKKTAERMALSVLQWEEAEISNFANNLLATQKNIKKCVDCNNVTTAEKCDICLDDSRDRKVICVVEDIKKIIVLEKLQVFSGKYYVIAENISPYLTSEQIDNLIKPLLTKVREEGVEEIIFALKLSIEGETTMAYITKLLEKDNVKITKLAQGVPHGADIDYVDPLTIEKAFVERK